MAIKVKTYRHCDNPNCDEYSKESGKQFKKQNSFQKFCSYPCQVAVKGVDFKLKKPIVKKQYSIPKVSDKRKIENSKYSVLRIEFLGKTENKICPITKWPTTDIHHKKGRIGDLLLDTRYWVALSREGHQYVEENPEWAKENGYSLDRLSKD